MSKVITLTGDTTLTAYYTQGYALAVTSTPVNTSFTIGGVTATTPYNQVLTAGTYVIVMPATVGNYRFAHWQDGDVNLNKSVPLSSDLSLVAIYEYVQPPPNNGTLEIHAYYGSGEVVANGAISPGDVSYTTPSDPISLAPGTYTVACIFGDQTATPQTAVVQSSLNTRLDFHFAGGGGGGMDPTTLALLVLAAVVITAL